MSDESVGINTWRPVYLIEATDFEKHCLWRERTPNGWRQDTLGWSAVCGSVEGNPVNVVYSRVWLDGQEVVFFEAVSRFVDHEMVREAIEDRWPGVKRTDANNFHLALHEVERLNEAAIEEALR